MGPCQVSRHGVRFCCRFCPKNPFGALLTPARCFGTLFAHQTTEGVIFGAFLSVAGCRKKIVAFWLAALLGCGRPGICLAQSTSGKPTGPLFEKSSVLFAADPNFLPAAGENSGVRELFFKTMLSVLLVIVLGAAAIYVSKKFLPRITNLPGKEIRIIETVHLGPHKMVHLLRIGNQRLLIGSTNQSITKLADVTDALSEMDLPAFKAGSD